MHFSHYGRMCPIETPEGPNIGLIGALATYARVNEFGFIESPYRKVIEGKVTDEIVYLPADEEEEYVVAQANTPVDGDGTFIDERVLVRRSPQAASLSDLKLQLERDVFYGATTDIGYVPPNEVQLMDVSPKQIVSVATSLIPFLEHDDANRALMGANMQKQAVPAAAGRGALHRHRHRGPRRPRRRRHDPRPTATAPSPRSTATPSRSSTRRAGRKVYRLAKFRRSNQDTCINQKPRVVEGQQV